VQNPSQLTTYHHPELIPDLAGERGAPKLKEAVAMKSAGQTAGGAGRNQALGRVRAERRGEMTGRGGTGPQLSPVSRDWVSFHFTQAGGEMYNDVQVVRGARRPGKPSQTNCEIAAWTRLSVHIPA
jgi:hypothetical protein